MKCLGFLAVLICESWVFMRLHGTCNKLFHGLRCEIYALYFYVHYVLSCTGAQPFILYVKSVLTHSENLLYAF